MSLDKSEKKEKSSIMLNEIKTNFYKNNKDLPKILLILLLISLVKCEEMDISSKYEITLIISGSGSLKILNSNFPIMPSFIEVDSDEKEANTNIISNLKADAGHIVRIRWNTEITNCSSMFSGLGYITKINMNLFDFSKVVDMSKMFSDCTNLATINFREADTSKVTDMNRMFYNCKTLTDLNLSHFQTSLVTNMDSMFYNCWYLYSLNLFNFYTDQVTNMANMFYNCYRLKYLNISNFNTNKVTKINGMFKYCEALVSLNLSHFNTSLISNLDYIFYDCSSLKLLDITNFDTSKVTNMSNMFYNCYSLTSLDLGNFNTNLVQSMYAMFYECNNLKSLDLSNFNTENCKNMQNMFYYCNSLISLNLSNFNTENCTNMQNMFYYCNSLISLNLSNFNTGNCTNMQNMFSRCINLQTLDISNFDLRVLSHPFNFINNLKALKYLNMKNVNATTIKDMSFAFNNLSALISLDVSNFITSSVKYMQYMFSNCTSIEYIDLSSLNTENVIYMYDMFYNCPKLKILNLSNFNTENVEKMELMFYGCNSLESINITNFNTKKVNDMKYMFYNCYNLKSLDLSNFNTENVISMEYMFYYCSKLESLNVLSFDTGKVTNMNYMFYNCKSLKSLDLSSFKTGNVQYMKYMIYSCSNLISLDISNFDLNSLIRDYNYYYTDSTTGQYYYSYSSNFNFLTNLNSLLYLNLKNVDASIIYNFNSFFINLNNLISIDLSNFTISKGIRMSNMFSGCTKLEYLNLSNFNTKNVFTMQNMFYNCKSLKTLDLSGFDTKKVFDISNIFYGCNSLISLDISNFDLRAIGSFHFLQGLYSLQYLNLKNVNIYNITDLSNSFYNLYSLISIDFSNTNISSAIDMENMFNNCTSLQSLDLSNLDTQKVTNMKYLFNNCHKLQFIDLSNWNTTNVTDMEFMFKDCNSMISLDLSNLDTSSVTSMQGMFTDCKKLEFVNMKNINTKSLENMRKMFYGCSNLKYINFYSITDNEQIIIKDIFSESSENFTYCIKDETKIMTLFQKLILLNNTQRDCSFYCYNHDMRFIIEENKCIIDCSKNEDRRFEYDYECYDSCPKRTYLPNNQGFICENLICEYFYDYEQKKCIDKIPDGYFLNDTELQTIDRCHEDCRTCDKKEDANTTNCNSCFESKYLFYGNCISNCQNGFFIDKEDNNIKKCKCENIMCLKCSKDSLSKNMCISCNDDYYPIFNDISNIVPYINCYFKPEGYYLDKNDKLYKKCYSTCKTCYDKGDEIDHKCNECSPSYSFKLNNNCYRKCPYYYYFDEFNDYHCTRTDKCSNEFNKLLLYKGRCVNDCKIDDIFKYEFQHNCLQECPIFSKSSEEDEFYCEAECPEDRPYEIIKTQECVKNCSTTDILHYLCILNNKNGKLNRNLKEIFIKDFIKQYLSGELDSAIESEQNGIIFIDENIRFQLVNYENQKVSNNNMTNIHLGGCEKKLRDYYHIPKEENLVIFKVEVFEEGIKMPIVQYKIYKGKGRENLDLRICDEIKIDILVPVSINEDELYKYNLTGDYYNNICFTYTSENGTDIPLKDRQNLFIKNNLSVCEENCNFEEYDKRTKKAVCKCDVKIEETPINQINFTMETFYKYCIDIRRMANLDVLKCYYILFTKKGILNNYGSFITLPIILFHIISNIIFHFRDLNLLRNKIGEIVNFKKILESLNVKKNKKNNETNIEQMQSKTGKNNNKNKKN